MGRFPPPVHGAAVMNENYFEALDKDKNFEVKRIKINYSDSLDELGKINFRKFFGFFAVFFKILFNLIEFRPNIVYFELAPKGFAFYRDSVYVLLCKLFRKKIIFHFQAKGFSKAVKNPLVKKYYRFIFRKTKSILLSETLYYDVKDFMGKNQIEILPNAVKDEITDKEFKKIIQKRKQNKKLVLLFLSNMIESKGPLDVLKICNELKKEKIDFECNFVGKFQDEDFRKRFENQLKEFKLEKHCKYLGPKYGKEKQKILEKTNYLLFPTQYLEECFPLVILEAFMYGIPILAYDNGAIREIISKGFLGFVSQQGNWRELISKLKMYIIKRQESLRIREHFKRNNTFNISSKKFKKILLKS